MSEHEVIAVSQSAKVVFHSLFNLAPTFTIGCLIVQVAIFLLFLLRQAVKMQTFIVSKVHLTEVTRFNEILLCRWEAHGVEGCVSGSLEVARVDLVKHALVLFMHLIKCECLSPAIVC